jgi:glycosyltransferase involved in cell wall biosynthesis
LRSAIENVKHFIFVSESTRKIWTARFPNISASTINNGIDYSGLVRAFRHVNREAARVAYCIQPQHVTLLNVGTWTERKGQLDIVRAVQRIDRRLWPRLKVLLIGANNSEYGLKMRAEIANSPAALRERMIVVEETTGLADRTRVMLGYAAADVFVFTSRVESYPRVVNEAMFAGLPIVTTPCFGVVEQVERDQSARFYDMGATEELETILKELICDAELRKRLGSAARHRALYDVTQYGDMIKKYLNVYDGVTATSQAG